MRECGAGIDHHTPGRFPFRVRLYVDIARYDISPENVLQILNFETAPVKNK